MSHSHRKPHRPVGLALAAMLVVPMLGLGAAAGPVAAAELGGPVILGGDDLTDHGFAEDTDSDGTCETPRDGWNYIKKALENIAPEVTRANAGNVAALGSAAEGDSCSGGAGAAIASGAAAAGLPVTFYDGADAINAFFDDLRAGTVNPKIAWIAGTGAGNDLDSEESQALADNATTIGDFVNGGGGLMSHGTEYGWLSGLLPGVSTVDNGNSDDLYLTPAGQTSFPGLTDQEVNAGPWHNYFECTGDPGGGPTSECFGGLAVLTASNQVDDANGKDAAVILGGASAQLPGSISLDPGQAFNNPTKSPTHSVTATVRDDQGNLVQGADVSFLVVSGPNAGAAGSDLTDSNGQATFGWTSNGAEGTDVVRASFVDDTGQTRSIEATKVWDKTRPTCRGFQRSVSPHRTVVTVQDPLAGIASITASPSTNATLSTDPAAYEGSTSDVTVTLTRQNENQPGRARVAITDRAGNVGYCTGTGYLPV